MTGLLCASLASCETMCPDKFHTVSHCRDAQALQEKLAKKAEQAGKAAAGGK